jgi:hypothetical protein
MGVGIGAYVQASGAEEAFIPLGYHGFDSDLS